MASMTTQLGQQILLQPVFNYCMMLQALRLFPAVVIVPTMQISWTLFSVVSGGIYYQEYHAFTPFTAGMFGLGVLVSASSCTAASHAIDNCHRMSHIFTHARWADTCTTVLILCLFVLSSKQCRCVILCPPAPGRRHDLTPGLCRNYQQHSASPCSLLCCKS